MLGVDQMYVITIPEKLQGEEEEINSYFSRIFHSKKRIDCERRRRRRRKKERTKAILTYDVPHIFFFFGHIYCD